MGGVNFCSTDRVKVYSEGISTLGYLKTGIVSPFTAPRKSAYQLNWLLLLQFASLTQDALPFFKVPTRVTSKVAFKPGTDGWNIKRRKGVYWQVEPQDQKRLGLRKYPYYHPQNLRTGSAPQFDRPSHSLPILSSAGQVAYCDPIRSSITNLRHPGQPGLCCLLFFERGTVALDPVACNVSY